MFKEVNTIDSNVDMDAIESIIATHINELIDELEFVSSELGMTPLEYIYDDDSVIDGDIVESESTNLIPQKIVKH